jgi:hypothetical protein
MESRITTICELIKAQIELNNQFEQSFKVEIDEDINAYACFAVGNASCDYKDEFGDTVLTAATWDGYIQIFDENEEEVHNERHSFTYKF